MRWTTAFLLLGLAWPVHAQTTVVILVRHAEQEAGQDPGLSAAGRARADSLLSAVRDAGLDAIYHTQYNRTRQTAMVVAEALGIQTTEIGPRQGASATDHAAEVAAHILEHHAGGTVLVVGHSNTVPLIAAALGVPDPPRIVETEYWHMFTVVRKGSEPGRLIHSRYGS